MSLSCSKIEFIDIRSLSINTYIYTYTHNFIDSLDRYYIDIDIASIRTIQIDIRYRYRYIDIDSILTLFE